MAAVHTRAAIGGQNADKSKWVLAWPGWVTNGGGVWPIVSPTAQSGTLDETTYDPLTYAIHADTFDSLLVMPQFAGGGTVTIEGMLHDEEAKIWVSWIQAGGAKNVTSALATGQCFELKTAGRTKVFFRIHATSGTVTNLELLVGPGAGRSGGFTRP